MKIEEMTDNLWKFWVLNKFSLLAPLKKCIENSVENMQTARLGLKG